MKQYEILQVRFGKIWQIEFRKITVSKRIKRTKITLICGLFLYFAASINSNNKKYKIDEINTNYNRNNTIYYIYINSINSLYRTFYYI